MFSYIYLKKVVLLILLSLFIVSCENTGDKQSIKQIAITLIANYADGTGPAPTIRNYEDAGIIGVNAKNIDELNAFIETLVREDIDTEEELNAVVDGLGVSLASDIFGPVITIHGPNPLTLFKGDTYKKVCATAIDNRDGEVTVYVKGDVDTNHIGTYIVTYSAVDEAGNLVSVDRVVHVEEIPPVTTPLSTPLGLHIKILIDSFAHTPFTINLANTNNGDTLSIIELNTPSSTPYSFSQTLNTGDSYNITLTEVIMFPPGFPQACRFQAFGVSMGFTANPAIGVMGTSDIILTVQCPGP